MSRILQVEMKPTAIISIILTAASLTSCIQGISRTATGDAIRSQMQSYPESTLKDVYKNFFQDAFGPGHLMGADDDAVKSMRQYVMEECEVAKGQPSVCPDYELTGWKGRFYRVDLRVINDGRVPLDVFMDAFMESARQFRLPDVEKWAREWDVICRETKRLNPDIKEFSRDSVAIRTMLSEGKYASHHSEEYNQAYHPHYRLIERRIFEKELLPLIKAGRH